MSEAAYTQRRAEIQTYFDRTAVDAWKRFATDAPLGRIRATVREGRGRMRALMLSRLPDDLSGWRILDAGCGTGAMSIELARRGADVLGVDLAPEIIRFARETAPADTRPGRITFASGDMLAREHGHFDAVVAMDSLIHYRMEDCVAALSRLCARTSRRIVFTFAPRTPALAAMHAVGRLFPRSDRAPSIVPVRAAALRVHLEGELAAQMWESGYSAPISHGFYTSQMMELVRT